MFSHKFVLPLRIFVKWISTNIFFNMPKSSVIIFIMLASEYFPSKWLSHLVVVVVINVHPCTNRWEVKRNICGGQLLCSIVLIPLSKVYLCIYFANFQWQMYICCSYSVFSLKLRKSCSLSSVDHRNGPAYHHTHKRPEILSQFVYGYKVKETHLTIKCKYF